MRGPDFFVIGAQRAGTTRLAYLLAQHPEVAIPGKEPHYFLTDETVAARRDWYADLYADTEARLLGDGSTGYTMRAMFPGVAERIARHNPAARLIYIVRHPMRRIESAWRLALAHGHVSRFHDFNRVVEQHPELLVDASLYWTQLSDYRDHFPDQQIKVVAFEDFTADEPGTVADCWSFLGAEVMPVSVDDEWRQGSEDEWRHRSEGERRGMALPLDLLMRVGAARKAWRRVPTGLRAPFTPPTGRLTTRPRPRPVVWDEAVRERVRATVTPEAEHILRYMGKHPAYWADTKAEFLARDAELTGS